MIFYTDGATSSNGYENAQGGWAFVVIDENDELVSARSGHIENATNNICELTAIIEACTEASELNKPIIIYSDSAYCINCYKQKWYKNWQKNGWLNSKKQPVANKELWEKLIPYFENEDYKFEKVKGHCGNRWNEFVDKLAVAAKEFKQ